MTLLRTVLVSALVGGVAGCTTGWSRHGVELPFDVPGADGDGDAAPSAAPVAPPSWWHAFGDPDLDAAVALALDENLSLQAGLARVRQAEAVVRQVGSGLFPQVDAGASASRSRVTVPPTGPTQVDQFGLSVSAAWELDVWGRVAAGRDAAELDAEAARADLDAVRVSLSAQVVEAWLDAAHARERGRLLDAQLETQERFLEILHLRLSGATATALDIEQQRSVIAALRAQRALNDARSETALLRLAALQGRIPSPGSDRVADTLPLLPPTPSVGLPADLLERRPDVAAARLRAEAADARAAQAVAARLPSLRLSGSVFLQAASLTDLFDEVFWNLVGSLTAPVFDGGRRRAEIERTRAAFDERVLAYADAIVQAVVEVETALALEGAQLAYLDDLAEREAAAARAVELARAQYREGVADYLRVLTTWTTLLQVQQDRLDARRQLLSYRVQLHRALGGGWGVAAPEPR